MKLGEFFVELGVLSDQKSVREFAASIGDMTLGAAAGVAALVGLEYELVKIAGEAMNAAVGFEMFRSETGLSWQELQRWQIAGQQVNVTSESIASSISQLQRNLAEIRLGRGNIAPFQMLGIDVRGNAFSVLAQLRDRLRGLDRATATNMIAQMGISPDMIRVLELTNSDFQKLSGTIHGLTSGEEQAFYRSKQAIITWGLVLKEYGIDLVYRLVILLEKFIGYINRIPGDMRLLISSVVLLAAAFYPVTAAIVGLLLLFDDLSVYLTGGDSLIGAGIEGFKKLGKELKEAFSMPGGLDALGKLAAFSANAATGGYAAPLSAGAKNVVNHFNVNVTGTGDATSIALAVTREISKHMGRAEQQVNNQGH